VLSIKLPKLILGLSLVVLAGASSFPALAQTVDDDGARYDSQTPPGVVGDDDDDDDGSDDGDDSRDAAQDDDDDDRSDDDRDVSALSEEERRCAAEFSSFDPVSGTYLNDNGERERCPHLF
jgi:hypothetical protein